MEQQTKQPPLVPIQTMTESLMLDIYEEICNDPDLKSSASVLINWDFREKFCKDLDPKFWTQIDTIKMMIVSTHFEFWLSFPKGFGYLMSSQREFNDSIGDMLIMDWFSHPPIPKEVRLLKTLHHPFTSWAKFYLNKMNDTNVAFIKVLEVLPMKYLLMVALKGIIDGASTLSDIKASAEPEVETDYIVISELFTRFQKF